MLLIALCFCISFFCPQTSNALDYDALGSVNDFTLSGDSLWVATKGGLVCWDIYTHEWSVMTEDDGLPSSNIQAVVLGADGTIWCGIGYGGIVSYREGEWSTVLEAPSENGDDWTYRNLQKLTVAPDGTLWVGMYESDSEGFTYLKSYDGKSWKTHLQLPNSGYGEAVTIHSIRFEDDGDVIASSGFEHHGTWRASSYRGTIEETNWPEIMLINDAHSLKYAENGHIWYYYDPYPGPELCHLYNDVTESFTTENGLPYKYVLSYVPGLGGTVWIKTGAGLSYYDGTAWYTYADPYDAQPVLVDDEGSVWCITEEGVVRFDREEYTLFILNETSVDSDEANPKDFTIASYPNPFNPTTTIRFTLPESCFVTLTIYSISGQKIHELIADFMSSGTHTFSWDGRNTDGFVVSSGIYISHIQAGKFTTSGRMVLMR